MRSERHLMQKQAKFGIGIGVIVVSMAFLGLARLRREQDVLPHDCGACRRCKAMPGASDLRVGGTVEPGSIHRMPGRVDFVLQGEGKSLPVSYVGSDPLPDTFIDKSQALVEGSLANATAILRRSRCRRSARRSMRRRLRRASGESCRQVSGSTPPEVRCSRSWRRARRGTSFCGGG